MKVFFWQSIAAMLLAATSLALVSIASAGSVSLSIGPCVGGGYSYYTNAAGGTYELYSNNNCIRWHQYAFWDGADLVNYSPQQGAFNISRFQVFDAPTQGSHMLVYGFSSDGPKYTTGY